jgi:flagellum-specific ATP synthase
MHAPVGQSAMPPIATSPIGSRAVVGLSGLVVDIDGLNGHVSWATACRSKRATARNPAEVVGFRGASPRYAFRHSTARAWQRRLFRPENRGRGGTLAMADAWLRVLNPLAGHGRTWTIGGRSALGRGERTAGGPARPGPRLDVGVRALDCFATPAGQRLLFSGSGVGSDPARHARPPHATSRCSPGCERGREVREFLEDDLGRKVGPLRGCGCHV